MRKVVLSQARRFSTSPILAAAVVGVSQLALMQSVWGNTSYWWDPNLAAADIGGAGTMSNAAATQNWNTLANGSGSLVAFPSAATADGVFAGPTAGNVLMNTNMTFGDMKFDTAGYAVQIAAGRSLTVTTFSGSALSSTTFQPTTAAGNRLLTLSTTATPDFAGTLTNNGSGILAVTKAGAGTLTLSGTSNYTGGTIISAGTLKFAKASAYSASSALTSCSGATLLLSVGGPNELTGAGAASVVGAATLLSGSTLAFDASNATGPVVYASAITAPANLSLVGTGALKLTQANSYTGTTTVSGGTLILGNTAAVASAAITLNTGSTLSLATDTSVAATNLSLPQNASITLQSDRATAGAGITHTLGALTTAANTTVNVVAGSNATGSTAAVTLGNITTTGANSTAFTFNPTTANLTIGAVNFNGQNQTLNLQGSALGNQVTGTISVGGGTGGSKVVKSGTGTWTLSGNNANSSVTVNDGILQISGSGTLSASTGSLNVLGGTLALGSTTQTVGTFTISGTSTVSGGTLRATSYIANNATGTATITANIDGSAGLTKSNSGTLTLGATNSNFTGAVTLSGGTLSLGAQNALGNPSSIALSGGTVLQFNGDTTDYSSKIAAWGGVHAGFEVANGQTVTFASNLTGNTGAASGMDKAGQGTLVLGGTNAWVAGTTHVLAGTLQLSGSGTLGGGNVAVDSGSSLDLNGVSVSVKGLTGAGAISSSNPASLTLSALSTYSGPISGAVKIISTGGASQTITLTGNNSYTGGTKTTTAATIVFSNGALGTGTIDAANTSFSGFNNFQWAPGNTQDISNQLVVEDSCMLIADTNGNDVIFGSPIGVGTLRTGRLNKAGSGTLTMNAANTNMVGSITLTGGTLAIKNNNAIGSGGIVPTTTGGILDNTSGGPLTIPNGIAFGAVSTSFIYGGSSDLTVSGGVSASTGTAIGFTVNGSANLSLPGGIGNGLASLAKDGTGTLTLRNNSFGNGTAATVTLNLGQLNLNHANALGATGTGSANTLVIAAPSKIDNTSAGPVTINTGDNSATYAWNADFDFVGTQNLDLGTGTVTLGGDRQVTVTANTLAVGGAIDGGFGLTKLGGGTLHLKGNSSYSGATVVANGTLLVSDTGAINSTSGISVNGTGSTFQYTSSTPLTKPVTFTGGGSFIYNSSSTTPSPAITVGSGAVLSGTGYIDSVTITSGGIDSPGNSPGIQHVGTFQLDAGAKLVFDLGPTATPGVDSDQIEFIALGNNLLPGTGGNGTLQLANFTLADVGQTYTVFTNVTTAGYQFSAITGFDTSIYAAHWQQNVGANSYELSVSLVPEPSTITLGAAILSVSLMSRRRKAERA